jgi:hypothetical protein
MEYKCYFCDSSDLTDVKMEYGGIHSRYLCPTCGDVYLDGETADDIPGENFTENQKRIISIWIRNEYEKRNRKHSAMPLTLHDMRQILRQYSPLDPLAKMDNALLNIERASGLVGSKIDINYGHEYPYYHCFGALELLAVLSLLHQEGFINVPDSANPHNKLSISAKGYQKLRDIKSHGKDSRQCFVAMWFSPEMNNVYEEAIKPAIEYKEEGETEARFRAIKIDNVEHINDINDEIIAAIRRSRFMVCDLTGYRGGVYFEAGFANGLGLDVIYTCRKDWIKSDFLKNKESKQIEVLYDSEGREIQIRKEGIHFDIEHMNRIEWEEGRLDEFKAKLMARIKAVIL